MTDQNQIRQDILHTIESGKGVLFAQPAIVHRGVYTGRSIIKPNSDFVEGVVDDRYT